MTPSTSISPTPSTPALQRAARTSPASSPAVTTRAARPFAASAISGCDAGTIAISAPSKSSDSSRITPSRLPSPSRCSSDTDVITAMSGSTIPRSFAISPGTFIPISITATSASSGIASSVSGTPTRLLRFPIVACTVSVAPSVARISSFVVVFPFEPPTPITVPRHARRR